jgi:hypothetical protein
MAPMTQFTATHAPAAGLSRGQVLLAAAVATLALAVTPVFFIVMFTTVNDLLGKYFDGWAWTVPVATEITFLLLFLLAVLFEWLRRPSHVLWAAPYPFAALSALLNVLAANGTFAAMAGHLAVTLAFFAPVMFAKAGVRRLLVTDAEIAFTAALADATAYARDVLRSALGIFWRFRAPVLLRRQLRSGRLPARVLAAVHAAAEGGGGTLWEAAVETWIAAAVALPERTAEVVRAARAEASQSALATPAATPPEASPAPPAEVSAEASGEPSAVPREAPAERPAHPSRRPPRLIPKKATDDQLADLLVPLLEAGEDVSPTRVVKLVREAAGGRSSIGHDRAGRVLERANGKADVPAPVAVLAARRQA